MYTICQYQSIVQSHERVFERGWLQVVEKILDRLPTVRSKSGETVVLQHYIFDLASLQYLLRTFTRFRRFLPKVYLTKGFSNSGTEECVCDILKSLACCNVVVRPLSGVSSCIACVGRNHTPQN